MVIDAKRDRLVKGDSCSYELHVPNVYDGEFVEIDVSSIVNTNVLIYEGAEALLNGDPISVGTTDVVVQFAADETLYMVADFTSDKSELLIEYRRTFTPLVPKEEESAGEAKVIAFSIETSELYELLFVLVASIIGLTVIVTLCHKLCSRSRDEIADGTTKNSDVSVLHRLDSVKRIDDPKYAAKTRDELKKRIAEQMEKQAVSDSDEDEEAKSESDTARNGEAPTVKKEPVAAKKNTKS